MTALAVVDDIGGIIIIALFYSGEIAFEPLLISLALLALLYVGGRMRVNNIAFYYIIGFFVWMLFLESGIHPTIAGVLVAFTVPARPVVKLDDFTCEMTGYLDMLDYTEVRHSRKAAVLSSTQIQVLNNIHSLADKTISPLQSIANKLHPLVNYLILPLFAFVNAGVTFGDIGIGSLPGIPLAVFFGLFAGKSLGIFLFTYIFVRLRLATMPEGVSKRNLFGVSMLGGIGFTVALFIANLSFAGMPDVGVELLNQAKLGVFAGSFISGLCGYLILKKVLPKIIEMDRRKFIQTGIAGVAGLSLVRTGLANIQMTVPSDISVDRVKLGKTGLKVSRIAMGTGTKGWNYQSNQTRLGLDNFVKIARHGYERGIRFFDMADMYGSQPFVGKALKELPREKLTLMTKMWTYDEGSENASRSAKPSTVSARKLVRTISISSYCTV